MVRGPTGVHGSPISAEALRRPASDLPSSKPLNLPSSYLKLLPDEPHILTYMIQCQGQEGCGNTDGGEGD